MQCTRQVHDGAYSGANQPVHGKTQDNASTYPTITPLLCPCLQDTAAPEHAPTALPARISRVKSLGYTHTTPTPFSYIPRWNPDEAIYLFPHKHTVCAEER